MLHSFPPMYCDSGRMARCPPSGRIRGRPASGPWRRRHSSAAFLRVPGRGHRPTPPGQVPAECFPEVTAPVAREGPFLEESSTESIRSLGPGCAFRNTTYRLSDYAEPAGDYGLLLNHPRFVEWIGVPQSAGLLELGGRQWVDKLSRDQAVTAAVHLQRDVGLMQTNVDVLDQYALSLQKAASRIIDHCLGPLCIRRRKL